MSYQAIDYTPPAFSKKLEIVNLAKSPDDVLNADGPRLADSASASKSLSIITKFVRTADIKMWSPDDFDTREVWCASLTLDERKQACKMLADDYDNIARKARGHVLSYVAERMLEQRRFMATDSNVLYIIRFHPNGFRDEGQEAAGWFDRNGNEFWLGYDMDSVYSFAQTRASESSPDLTYLYPAYDMSRKAIPGHWGVKP
jgi:hypothetical protein